MRSLLVATFFALAGLLFCLNARAGIGTGYSLFASGADPGELFLAVFDPVRNVSYTRDLGIVAAQVEFDDAEYVFSPDEEFLTQFAGSVAADLRYSIIGVDNGLIQNDAVNSFLGVWTTSNQTVPIDSISFSTLASMHYHTFRFVSAVNSAAPRNNSFSDNLSKTIFDPVSLGFYANLFSFNETFGSLLPSRFSGAPIGTTLDFHLVIANFATDGVPQATRFERQWLLTEDGMLFYSDDPLGNLDSDQDGVIDALDNCLVDANPDQVDSNNDGFGNVCDPDINNDCIVNNQDLGLIRQVFFSDFPFADFNSDGVVNLFDLGVMRTYFFQAPGPSALADCE